MWLKMFLTVLLDSPTSIARRMRLLGASLPIGLRRQRNIP
jgi:hypothetical protein